MKTFYEYVKEQGVHNPLPLSLATGDSTDPDKPRETELGELTAALEEILEIAKRAINSSGGLAEKSARRPSGPPKDKEPENRVVRPQSDSPEGLFGLDK